MGLSIFLLALPLNFASRATAVSSCFRRDGSVDSAAAPCDTTSGVVSMCCVQSSSVKCLANGVCQQNSIVSGAQDPDPLHSSYFIDGCTDSAYSSPVCLGGCANGVSNQFAIRFRDLPLCFNFHLSNLWQSFVYARSLVS